MLLIKENAPKAEQKKKRAAVPQIWTVISRARKIFNVQLEKSNAVKLACLKKFACEANNDLQKFYNDYMKLAGRLMDSIRYNQEAKGLNCDPRALATHIVYLGSAWVNKALKLGLEGSGIAKDIDLYREPFLPDDPQEFAR